MNAKYLRALMLVGLVFFQLSFATKAAADPPPDILEAYTISIVPQEDGSLAMNYVLENYCTYSDWPSDQPYLQIGVPNDNFTIGDWGPKDGPHRIVNAEDVNRGGSFVQLDFERSDLPKNGDCFNLNFSIVQNGMAYPDPTNGNVTFKFIPAGWEFPIQVKHLTINWALPNDPSLLKLTDPNPVSQDVANMTWQFDDPAMDSSGMFRGATLKLAYDKGAFTLPAASAPASPSNGGDGGNGLGMFLLIVVIVIAVMLFVLLVLPAMFDGGGLGSDSETRTSDYDYTPPVNRRSSTRRSDYTYTPSTSRSSRRDSSDSDSDSSSSHGGGYGGSSGHSSSCVSMPSCACACACAGGGKVGCSRKGIGIQCLEDAVGDMTKEV